MAPPSSRPSPSSSSLPSRPAPTGPKALRTTTNGTSPTKQSAALPTKERISFAIPLRPAALPPKPTAPLDFHSRLDSSLSAGQSNRASTSSADFDDDSEKKLANGSSAPYAESSRQASFRRREDEQDGRYRRERLRDSPTRTRHHAPTRDYDVESYQDTRHRSSRRPHRHDSSPSSEGRRRLSPETFERGDEDAIRPDASLYREGTHQSFRRRYRHESSSSPERPRRRSPEMVESRSLETSERRRRDALRPKADLYRGQTHQSYRRQHRPDASQSPEKARHRSPKPQDSPLRPLIQASSRDPHAKSNDEGMRPSHQHSNRRTSSPSPERLHRSSPEPAQPMSSREGGGSGDGRYRAQVLRNGISSRVPISISLSSLSTLPNGSLRARPPRLDMPFERAPPPHVDLHSKPLRPPSPPDDDRPPTPPSLAERPSSPPPPKDRPPTPPAPSNVPSPPPPPPSPSVPAEPASPAPTPPPLPIPAEPELPPSEPPLSPLQRLQSVPEGNIADSPKDSPSPPPLLHPRPTSLLAPSTSFTAPPAFHFRNFDLPRRSPTPSQQSDASVPDVEEERRSEAEAATSPVEPEEKVSTPPPPLHEPPPREIASRELPSYQPPPSVHRRPGVGNFLVLHDPATQRSKDGRPLMKRVDGGANGDVNVEDPRLLLPDKGWQRGRGSVKARSGFYELSYDWDESSLGTRPPPPPTAVLMTGLNALTTVDQIGKFLRPYGRIKEIDAKMDLRSGMQLGICWVQFEGPPQGRPGTGHDVALQVIRLCNGQRIGLSGDEKIKVVLDGRRIRTDLVVKEEMRRRYPPKKAPEPAAPPQASTSTPLSSMGADTPKPTTAPGTPAIIAPTAPRPNGLPSIPRSRPPVFFDNPGRNLPPYNRNPYFRAAAPTGPQSYLTPNYAVRPPVAFQSIATSFIAAPFAPRPKRDEDLRNIHLRRHSRSRSHSHSRCSTCSDSYSSDSEDDRQPYGRRRRSSYTNTRDRTRRGVVPDMQEDDPAVETIKQAIADNDHPYVFIDANTLPAKTVSIEHLRDHFRAFRPTQVMNSKLGWHLLFADDLAANRAKLLDNTLVQGHRLVLNVKMASVAAAVRKPLDDKAESPRGGAKVGKAWQFLTITKKNRPAPTALIPKVLPKVNALGRHRSYSTSSDSEIQVLFNRQRSKSPSTSESELSEEEPPRSTARRVRQSAFSDDDVSAPVVPLAGPVTPLALEIKVDASHPFKADVHEKKAGKKRVGKPKAAKGAKKARITSSPTIEIEPPLPVDPPVAEIKLLEETEIAVVEPTKKATKVAKPKKPPQTPLDKLFAGGEIEDEEDAYWLGQALRAEQDGFEQDFSDDEEELLDPKHPLYHTSGSWRAEGWKKVPQIAKSTYLPQRNRAAVSAEEAAGLTSGRTARVTGRRLALDMETHRKTAASATAESDLFAFNQLVKRKKQLRFARSAIEGYGLYAMESIQPGEMICEYVGEICRSAVAEIREQRYLKQGIGSSYLFRIDADLVCDATFRGSVSRLINHSCDPSASAKIISINGHSKIVIYARRMLHPGEEILYDYKFPLESDPELRVPCLCGAATCRGWLN